MKRPNGNGKGSDKKGPQTINGETGKPDPTPPAQRRIDLSNLRDVRIELANVYRAMDAGALEEAAATKRAYVLQAIGKVIEAENEATIMERITVLEEQLAGGVAGRLPAPLHGAAH